VLSQASKELAKATASGLTPLRYIGSPLPHWHTPLLLLHSAARSQWPQPLIAQQDAVVLLQFARACLRRLQVAAERLSAAFQPGESVDQDVAVTFMDVDFAFMDDVTLGMLFGSPAVAVA
jgi:hypothetical protein